jgi:hypothetical protein
VGIGGISKILLPSPLLASFGLWSLAGGVGLLNIIRIVFSKNVVQCIRWAFPLDELLEIHFPTYRTTLVFARDRMPSLFTLLTSRVLAAFPFPCLFLSLIAAPMAMSIIAPGSVVGTNLLFYFRSLIMRSIGCTLNDILDPKLDHQVARTQLRRIPRGAIPGAIPPTKGLVYASPGFLRF